MHAAASKIVKVEAPSQDHKTNVEDPSTKASLRMRKKHVLPSYLTATGKTKQIGTSKKRKRVQSLKSYPGRYGDLLQQAKNLEEGAEQAVAFAKTRKKVSGMKAAWAMAFSTRRLL